MRCNRTRDTVKVLDDSETFTCLDEKSVEKVLVALKPRPMKTLRNAILLSLALVVTGCAEKKTEYKPPEIKFDFKYDEILNSLKSGGQPGEISLNGKVVKSDETADERISIEQSAGASEKKTEISAKSLPKLNPELKRKDDYKPSKTETYLNLGCDLKDDSRVEGMTESKNKPDKSGKIDKFGAVASVVDKIFICGKVDTLENFVVLNANEVFLDNAEIIMDQPIGLFSITADVLSIEGKNLISTKGLSDSSASFMPAPSITLNIFEKVIGVGELKLKSAGGDYKPSEKK